MSRSTVSRGVRLAASVAVVILSAACGGAVEVVDKGEPSGISVSSGLDPALNGFSFANFVSSSYDVEFGPADLVELFGDGPDVCSSGTGPDCVITAEAASFAQVVNQARASGHCDGFSVVATTMFNERVEPGVAALVDDPATIAAITRGFATQFLPEVRDDMGRWVRASLSEKVAALEGSLADGVIDFSMGLFTDFGGHSVAPYAVEYLSPTEARVKLYDSNWPGKERWVDIDLTAETWTFSYSQQDPSTDPDPWTGDAAHMTLMDMSARNGTCPFCSSGQQVQMNAVLVRTTSPAIAVTVNGETYGPGDAAADGSVDVRPSMGAGEPDRSVFSFLIDLPSGESDVAELQIEGPASLFGVTPKGVLRVAVERGGSAAFTLSSDEVAVSGNGIEVSFADGDRVAQSDGDETVLSSDGSTLSMKTTTSDGQIIEIVADDATPVVIADAAGAGSITRGRADGSAVRSALDGSGTEEEVEMPDVRSPSVQLLVGLAAEELPIEGSRASRGTDVPSDVVVVSPTTTSTSTTTTTLPRRPAELVTTTVPSARTTTTTSTTVPAATTTTTTSTTVPAATTTTTTSATVPAATTTTVPVTTTTTVPADVTAPTVSVVVDEATNPSSVQVTSSEVGAVYAVRSSVSITSASDLSSITDGSLMRAAVVTSANVAVTVPIIGLSDGSYVVYAVDAAGNLSEQATTGFTVDTTAPTVSVVVDEATNPSSVQVTSSEVGAVYAVRSSVSITSASDLSSITDGSLMRAAVVTSANVAVTVPIIGLSDGSYVVYAVDAAGNLSEQATTGFNIARAPAPPAPPPPAFP